MPRGRQNRMAARARSGHGVRTVDGPVAGGSLDEPVEHVPSGGVPGHGSSYHEGRVANHVYFAALLEPAIWGAELAVALGDGAGRERVYMVEPTGPFEDDPNVTNKKFPGNVTQTYRTRHPIRIVGEVESWERHPPEVLQAMLERIAELRADGLDAPWDV